MNDLDRRSFLKGALSIIVVSRLPKLSDAWESKNDALQKKIDRLPEGGTLTFSKDEVYVDPSWEIRKSINIDGELHVEWRKFPPIFRVDSKKWGNRSFVMTAPTVAITTVKNPSKYNKTIVYIY